MKTRHDKFGCMNSNILDNKNELKVKALKVKTMLEGLLQRVQYDFIILS